MKHLIRPLCYLICLTALCAGLWINTGTLAPYAVSHHTPHVFSNCQYLANLDHQHFLAPFRFLNGEPVGSWDFSVVLRRVLYPILAFPLMKGLGFYKGGLLASALVQIFAVLFFVGFLRRHIGKEGALAGFALLATYPGLFYWSGLPYSYAMIVPCSLLAMIIVWKIEQIESASVILALLLVLGVLCLGYDLLPYFGAGALLLLLLRGRFFLLIPSVVVLVLPLVLVILYFSYVHGVGASNSNSDVYGVIIKSYLNVSDFDAWKSVLVRLPHVFWHNFLYSNFLVLPLLFIFGFVVGRLFFGVRLARSEFCVLVAVLAVFTFSNAAPPYENRWQMRGEWIARVYQPVFVVFVFYLSRLVQKVRTPPDPELDMIRTPLFRQVVVAVIFGAVCVNGWIVVGVMTAQPLTQHVYYNFYQHSKPDAIALNVEKYGARPYGYCKKKRGETTRPAARRRKKSLFNSLEQIMKE